ncbi:MAG TPA: DUF5074 domain-containing protein [Arachidicoccus sp.]
MNERYIILIVAALLFMASCRRDVGIVSPTSTQVVSPGQGYNASDFYLLNEGNMGSNQASLDYYDNNAGTYTGNIYPTRNPSVTLGLGDVGNDIEIYGNKLYVVVNNSNKVEVLDKYSAKKLGQIDIRNCRNAAFYGGKIYITSYDGFVGVTDTAFNFNESGEVQLQQQIVVGRQPEHLTVVANKLYVANSGGYSAPLYDSTVSVIDLTTNKEIKKIKVGINLNDIQPDNSGNLWVSSRGNYTTVLSSLYVVDTKMDSVIKHLPISVGGFRIFNNKVYLYSVSYNLSNGVNTQVSYAVIDANSKEITDTSFIKDGTENEIIFPYMIAIDSVSENIYVSDAKDYVTPGTLYCFSKNGNLIWKVMTGNIPGHIAFYQ